ncbi:MAG: hypothetical protein ISS57_11570 [Anaerolineales bacterium]|nr:hypothetical protein [Anaerolineales bacterium]
MIFTIYHRKMMYAGSEIRGDQPIDASQLGWPIEYHLVARIKAKNIEEAYAKTQHIDNAWHDNPDVETIRFSRSTSIGDVIQDESGRFWVVASFGFTELDGHLEALDQCARGGISLKISEACSQLTVWVGAGDNPLLGPVIQEIPGGRTSDFEAALAMACGRLLASMIR